MLAIIGDMVKWLEVSYAVSGRIIWYNHSGKLFSRFTKVKSGENRNSKRHTRANVHCSTTDNSQDMEAT